MANIPIYGTLHNDTNEPIATADQIFDTREGKNACLTDILDGITSVTTDPPTGFTDAEISALIAEVEKDQSE